MSLNQAARRFGLKRRAEAHHDATDDAMLALQLAGGLYQLDHGLLSPRRRAHKRFAGAQTPGTARTRTNLFLVMVIYG